MEQFLSFLALVVLVFIVWAIAKFVLRLTARVVGCLVTGLATAGFIFLIYYFFIR